VVEFPRKVRHIPRTDEGSDRTFVDLACWVDQGWRSAILTRLPARLPGEYSRFELVSFIGLGGMGQVWMARAPDYPDLSLAIKFFTHPLYQRHPALLDQCLQEARIGISIDSPNVARTYQALDLRRYTEEGWSPLALVMPLYEPSLQQVLEDLRQRGASLPLATVLKFANQLLAGVTALHDRGLVHRDLKPSNVLFRLPEGLDYSGPDSLGDATALVADLGTLCPIGRPPLFALGQDGWKAPELFSSADPAAPLRDRVADPAEDFYALGWLILALLDCTQANPSPAAHPPERVDSLDVPPSRGELTPGVGNVTVSALPGSGDEARWRTVANRWTSPAPQARRVEPKELPTSVALSVAHPLGRLNLPGFQVLEIIGRGGMGEVYLAMDTRLARRVAIKVLPVGLQQHPNARGRFQREAQALALLDHPNIVRIFETGETEDRSYIVMEHCQGGSLSERIRSGQLTPATSARILEAIARAVEFAHQRGVLHRDLKPSNILLTADGVPKIVDFGLVRFLDAQQNLTQSGMVMGTPAYMAPEQAQGRGDLGPGCDIWSLGAILYACLTGEPPFPFRGDSLANALYQVIHEEPIPLRALNPGVPPQLAAICHRCLQKDPTRRYGSAGELADDLTRFLSGKPVNAGPGEADTPAVLSWRRFLGGLVLAGILLGFSCLVYFTLSSLLRWTTSDDPNQGATDQFLALVSAGNWQAASEVLERISRRSPRVEVARLRLLLASNKRSEFESALFELSRRLDPGEEMGIPGVFQAERTGLDRTRRHQALDQLRGILGRSKSRLSPAEHAYAQALLTEQPDEQLRFLVAAHTADPFFQPALRALLLTRIGLGQFDQARELLRFLQEHFPEDRVRDLAVALLDLLDRGHLDPNGLARLQSRLPAEEAETVRSFLQLIATIQAGLRASSAPEASQLIDLAPRVCKVFGPGLGVFCLRIEALADVLVCTEELHRSLLSKPLPERITWPRSVWTEDLGLLDLKLQWELARLRAESSPELMQARLEEIVALGRRAGTVTTLLSRSSLLFRMAQRTAEADLLLLRERTKPSREQLDRLRKNLSVLTRQRPPESADCRDLRELLALIYSPLPGPTLARWQLDRPEGAAWATRQRLLLEMGRQLSSCWEELDAGAAPSLARAELEFWGESYRDALIAAKRALELATDDGTRARATELQDQARKALREPVPE
jgi:serine/threonine-protein kinase